MEKTFNITLTQQELDFLLYCLGLACGSHPNVPWLVEQHDKILIKAMEAKESK